MANRLLISIAIFFILLAGILYLMPIKLFVYEAEDLEYGAVKKVENSENPKTSVIMEPLIETANNKASTTEDNIKIEDAEKKISTSTAPLIVKDVLLNVPFTPQAPFGEWNDPAFQDGCEEAASIMAMRWIKNIALSRIEAKSELTKIFNWQKKNFGDHRDTSAEDTVKRIFNGYFGYKNVKFKKGVKEEDIIEELMKGNLVIAPMDGQKLKNPHYTAPGPERHMLVIRGYDTKTKEFITNDSGTRLGEKYRYQEKFLFDAIRDYPTGYHEPIIKIEKTIIIISR